MLHALVTLAQLLCNRCGVPHNNASWAIWTIPWKVHADSVLLQDKNFKEWTRGKLTHMTSQMRGLRNFATEVETFVRESCSSQESGAAASEPSYTQGHEGASVSNRPTQCASSASNSIARTTRLHMGSRTTYRSTSNLSAPTSATHFRTVQSDVYLLKS